MQSATKTVYSDDKPRTNVANALTLGLHQELPVTGWVSPVNNGPGFMTAHLEDTVNLWKTNTVTPELADYVLAGCEGICFANVTGAGFQFECDEPRETSIDWSTYLINSTIVRA